MKELTIKKRKIVIQGNSHYFYIPIAYIDNGQIDIKREYVITVRPQPAKKKEEQEKENGGQ